MNNTKTTKRALLTSVMAMLLCITMLIGTTYAWFTDSASTGVNKIQAGTLDVALEMKVGDSWVNAEGQTLGWVAADGRAQDQIFWEPGCTYQLRELRIVNKGNLALKYKIIISGIVGNARLLEVINFTYGDNIDINAEGYLAPNATTEGIVIKGHMAESAGNEYQGLSIDGIGITVVATQVSSESDSFGNGYDADVQYPVTVPANIVVSEGNTVVNEVTVESAKKVDGTNTSLAKVTIPAGAAVQENTNQLILTVEETATPAGFTVEAGMDTQTYEVDMKGLDKDSNTKLFRVELYVGTGLATFKLYHNGIPMNKKNSISLVSADQDYYYDSITGVVTFLTSTFSPFTGTYDKDSWANHAAESYAIPVDTESRTVTIASAEELALFAKQVNSGTAYRGYTVNLTADIDLEQYAWNPIGMTGAAFAGTFDGNEHTIKNLFIKKPGTWNVGFFSQCASTAKIQKVTFENANVVGYHSAAIVDGGSGGAEATFDNVTVKGNIQLTGGWYVGCILGKGYSQVSNCNVIVNEGSKIVCDGGYAGGIVGFMGEGNHSITNCTVENLYIESCWNGIGGISGILHYGNTITGCTVKNTIVHQKETDPDEIGRAAMIAGTYLTSESHTETLTNCKFIGGRVYDDTADYTGTAWIGGPWGGYQPEVGTVIVENNVYIEASMP